MKNTSRPSAVLPPLASFHVEKERRSFFAFITSALHSSRRLQAGRILRQYQHLIAPSEQSASRQSSQDSETREMLVTGRPAQPRLPAQPSARNEMGWLVAVAAAFLIIHIVAGTIWLRASVNETTASQAISSLYD
ncbi:hypothetical protein V1294_002083 [Bradyrhizobium sp. AZCC 1678]|uniref:hypothetical protein n=1 Tax=Bradyrhizobium sp. AZCC 1678 TaxID=3117030 RepID=UPI002FF2375C